ncbi:hypothetical protein FNH13_10650 [Ornithinimicrobium ciconiae]|uniref:Ribbon-helix-helix protein, CopG family n=1 Tax=Ornithinimicrobium ciconiae TaxID=2594265 RepID=A0A516GB32_9MICO|nr:hypothetical protein [Ornithinimicrobium ciconiae]QDO88725.1 hypothetical protein FNH13_10650 [Ornithinimicrobium ciconiae]
MSKDYSDAADWAEHDMELPKDSKSALRGHAAAEFGAEVLRRAGGRPALDPTATPGAHSPRRQVRLPQELSDQVDELATRTATRPASIMRQAIQDYVDRHPSPA